MSLYDDFLKSAGIDAIDTKTEYQSRPRQNRVKPQPPQPETQKIDLGDIETRDLTPEEFEEISGLPQKMMNMTVYQLVNKFGGVMSLNKYADFLSKLATIAEKEQKMQERKNQLIEKDFVISNLLKFVDLFVNQVMDSAESDTEEIIALIKTSEEMARKQIPDLRRKAYTKIAKECKKSMSDSLRRLKQKYDSETDAE